MAQGVRRGGFRKAQRAAQPGGEQLYGARTQGAAARAAKHRRAGLQHKGNKAEITFQRGGDGGQNGHKARLAALAGDGENIRPALHKRRDILGRESQRLRYAQAAAIEQAEHGEITRRDPGGALRIVLFRQIEGGAGFRFVHRMRQGPGQARAAHRRNGRVGDAAMALQPVEEGAQGGQLAGDGARARAGFPPVGQKGAEIQRLELHQHIQGGGRAGMLLEKRAELAQVAGIGLDGSGRGAAQAAHVRQKIAGGFRRAVVKAEKACGVL